MKMGMIPALALMASIAGRHETKTERKARRSREHWEYWSSRYQRQCLQAGVAVHGSYDWLVICEAKPLRGQKFWFRGMPCWQLLEQLRVRGTDYAEVRVKKVRQVTADFGAMEVD